HLSANDGGGRLREDKRDEEDERDGRLSLTVSPTPPNTQPPLHSDLQRVLTYRYPSSRPRSSPMPAMLADPMFVRSIRLTQYMKPVVMTRRLSMRCMSLRYAAVDSASSSWPSSRLPVVVAS